MKSTKNYNLLDIQFVVNPKLFALLMEKSVVGGLFCRPAIL